jgi:DNA repair protein SbcC/Rad50
MEIISLRILGIKSYTHKAIINFSSGRTLIQGPNGVGKSSLFYAVKFALFGRFEDKRLVDKDFYLMRDKPLNVELEFSHEGETYVIKRNITKGGKHTVNLESTRFEPIRNVVSAKNKLYDILNISGDLVDEAIFVSQGEFTRLLDQTPTELKKTFEGFFDIEKYRVFRKALNKLINSLQSELKLFDSNLTTLEDKIRPYETHMTQFRKLHSELNLQLKEEKTINAAKENQKHIISEINRLEKLINDLDEKITPKESEIHSLNKISNEFDQFRKQQPELDELNIEKIKNQSDIINGKYESLRDLNSNLQIVKLNVANSETSLSSQKQIYQDNFNIPFEEEDWDKLVQSNKTLNLDLQMYSRISDKFEQILKHLNKSRKTKIKEIDTDASVIFHLTITRLIKDIDLSNDTSLYIEKVVDEFYNQIDDKTMKYIELKGNKEKLETNKLSNRSLIQNHQSILNHLKKTGKHRCDKCFSMISEEQSKSYINQIIKTIDHLKDEIEIIESDLKNLDEQISETESKFSEFEKKYIVDKKKNIDKENAIQFLNNKVLNLKYIHDEIKELKATQPLNTYFKKLTEKRGVYVSIDKETSLLDETEILLLNMEIPKLIDDSQNQIELINKKNQLKSKILDTSSMYSENKEKLNHIFLKTEFSNEREFLSEFDKVETKKKLFNKAVSLIIKDENRIRKIDQLEGQLVNLKEEKDKLNLEIQKRDIQTENDIYLNLQNQLEILSKEIKRLKNDRDKLIYQLRLIRNAKNERKELIKSNEKNMKSKEYIKNIVELLDKYINYLLKVRALNLKQKMNKILQYMNSANGNLQVEIKQDESNFSIIVPNPEARKESYKNLSGGERMSVSYALRVALAQELANIGFIFLDEPTYGLDEERIEELATIIQSTNLINQTIIISHDSIFKEASNHILDVTRSGGSSRVKQIS